MSGKLDQSLDEIVSTHRRGAGRGRGGRRTRPTRSAAAAPAPAAPVGGIKKTTKPKPGAKVPTGPSGIRGDSKIMISNLPKDVNEAQIKEYLVQTVGPIKRVDLAYGPNGESRGVATVVFQHTDSAAKAAKVLKDVLLDKKPMKIDIILDAQRAADIIPAPKGLSERITAPKAQPKSAAAKPKSAVAAAGRGGKGKGGRGGRRNAPKKTTEEMDSEMADYWTAGGATEGDANASGAAPAANGDAPMEDEIL